MNKKGLSDVVVAVLLILLVLASVVIIWTFLRVFFFNSGSQISTDQFSSNFDIPKNRVMVNDTDIAFDIKRGSGDANISGFQINYIDSNKKSKTIRINSSLDVLESLRITQNYASIGLINISSIEVAPIYVVNGKETTGAIRATYKVGGNEIVENTEENNPPGPSANTNGLVAYYKFEDNLNNDVAGSPLTCPSGRCPTYASGKNGKSALFNDSVSKPYAEFSNLSQFNDEFTTSFWIYREGQGSGYGRIIGTKKSSTPIFDLADPGVDVGKLNRYYYNCGGGWIDTNQNLANGWEHVTIVTSGIDTKLYVNGVLISTTACSPLGTFSLDERLGLSYTPYDNENARVRIDDFMVYNKSLTGQEVIDLCKSQNGGVDCAQSQLLSYNIAYSLDPLGAAPLTEVKDNNFASYNTIGVNCPGGAINCQNFTINMTFSQPVVLTKVKLIAGQGNGNYNSPSVMNLYLGSNVVGTPLLKLENDDILTYLSGSPYNNGSVPYILTTYEFNNTQASKVYTWYVNSSRLAYSPYPNTQYVSIKEIQAYGY